jgi:hypothetical protein
MNGHQYQRSIPSIPTLSPNEIATQSIYEAPNHTITRPLKRKRSGFEIRDEPIADFIDKGLITPEYAVSYFNTYVPLRDTYIAEFFFLEYYIDSSLDFLEDVYVPPFISVRFEYSCLKTTQDRYIPIFDPEYDTFDSIRSRSSILLNAICTIGCMVENSKSPPPNNP